METLIAEVSRLLNETLCPGKAVVSAATEALDRLSRLSDFPLSLLSIAMGGENQGQRMAAATYLKNFTRRYMEGRSAGSDAHREFRNRLVQASLCAEPAVLKILVEALRFIVVADFVKENSWPELVPELKSVIQNSNLMRDGSNAQWKTINALTILQTTVKPFQKFDYPKERIVSLAFDVIAHVLETGHGWKLVSPHFSSLLESAIFPALIMNEKDISEWEGDADEYIRKNLPSELDDMSEWTADFFTARKSAISLLGIVSISKGSPVSMSGGSSSSVKRKKGDKRKGKQHYYGVLVAYGSLQDEMSADIYYSLLKALTMPDLGDVSCYPVRASAAGAVAELVQNGYVPPDWLPLLQVVIKRTTDEDGNESSLLYQLLCIIVEEGHEKVAPHSPAIVSTIASVISKFIPPIPEPWPQIVEWGFTALAKIAKVWEDVMPDEDEQNQSSNEYKSGWSTIAQTFSGLLQQAWLRSPQAMEIVTSTLPPPSCLDDASVLLEFIMQFVTEMDDVKQLKIAELLLVWADMISDWDAWEEVEDIAIFHCIQEAVHLHEKYALSSFFPRKGSASASSLPQGSIIEGFGAFISKAMSAYPSATLRACSCVHLLLHFPKFSFETECVKQSLAVAFTSAAFSRFKEIRDKPVAMWRPLLLDSSEDDVHEETEQEFLDRYAQAANAIECETVLEGDVEDEVQELELGTFGEVDPHEVVLLLIEKHHQLLLHGVVLPPQLKTRMLDTFPEYVEKKM
ncbi:hypothetical protein QJS10_CPA05g00115 [Acorus calamus]|uniref:Importin N-terminal domain-containing protein n=1 Tax=Acorus calamus TaxID=4465 RepID=A0AAV9EUN5_ACOCL|nr:hypothetical protein QJS10_CPA05g00115 [Acorus calamus]